MPGHTKMGRLTESVLGELRRLRYAEGTVTGYRGTYASLGRYAEHVGAERSSGGLAASLANDKFGTSIGGLCQAAPKGVHMKAYLRRMRVMLGWDLCGCVCKRAPGELMTRELPAGLQGLLGSHLADSRGRGHSEATIHSRGNRVRRLPLFLAECGGTEASCMTAASAHDYALADASLAPKSMQAPLAAVRSLHRHLCLSGTVAEDLVPTVPAPRRHQAPGLPARWTADDVDKPLGSIDGGGPAGERDHAMPPMVARLGLRASDIKAIRVSDVDWDARRISIVQHKTSVPLELPLPDDVGWATVDYLRDGRPKGAACPEPFVRHVAPLDAFGSASNLTHVPGPRARAAGIKAPGNRGTLHSLRHALATRLLGQSVPPEDISRMLGHASKRTTGIYLRMDVGKLAACPLDPREVGEWASRASSRRTWRRGAPSASGPSATRAGRRASWSRTGGWAARRTRSPGSSSRRGASRGRASPRRTGSRGRAGPGASRSTW